jgi:hypothetical protein
VSFRENVKIISVCNSAIYEIFTVEISTKTGTVNFFVKLKTEIKNNEKKN